MVELLSDETFDKLVVAYRSIGADSAANTMEDERWARKSADARIAELEARAAEAALRKIDTFEMMDRLGLSRAFEKYSAQLGWGLTPYQPECWAALDAAVAELARLRAIDETWRANVQAHAAAMRMVRDAIGEMFGPLASLESEEAVLLRGPEPHHDAEAIIAALARLRAAGTFNEGIEAAEKAISALYILEEADDEEDRDAIIVDGPTQDAAFEAVASLRRPDEGGA